MELSRSLLAGAASGSLMGIFFLGIGASALVSQPSTAVRFATLVYRGTGPVKAPVLLVAIAIVVVWSVVGAIFGLACFVVAEAFPLSAIGSPNAVYTIGIIIISVVVVLLAALLRRRYVGAAVATGIGLAVIFGWLLPWLAS